MPVLPLHRGPSTPPQPPTSRTKRYLHRCEGRLRYIRASYIEYFSEFIGTLVMALIIYGCHVQNLMEMEVGSSSYTQLNFISGIGAMSGVYVCGERSGGHLNPALTFAFATWRDFPWRKVPGYWVCQILATYCASGLVYLLYEADIDVVNHGDRTMLPPSGTGYAFVTSPSPIRGNYSCLIAELLGTAVLVGVILACIDTFKTPATHGFPIIVALLLMGILSAFGSRGGLSLNPALDLGGRLLLASVGYGSEPFTTHGGYMWIPIVGPIVGGVVGGFIFELFCPSTLSLESLEAQFFYRRVASLDNRDIQPRNTA